MSVGIYNQTKNYHFSQNKLSDGNPFNLPNPIAYSTKVPMNQINQPSSFNQTQVVPQSSNENSNQLYNTINKNLAVGSKYTSNVCPPSSMNIQDRVIAYGHDAEENYFKRSLRKPAVSNAIQSSSYNIINNLPYNLPYGSHNGTGTVYYNNIYNQKKDYISDLFNYGSGLNSYNKLPQQNGINNLTNTIINSNTVNNTNSNGNLALNTQMKLATPQKNIGAIGKSFFAQDFESKNPEMTGKIQESISYSSRTPNRLRMEKESPTLSEYYETNCSSVKEYAYKEDSNARFRNYMEDRGKAIDCFKNNPSDGLFCLFDGHGGGEVSKFLQEKFPSFFKEVIPSQNLESTFTSLFQKVDLEIKGTNYFHVGATACIIYITKEQGKSILYSANIGDTRSVLINSYSAKRLSYDHRASDKNEYTRIINAGGIVFAGRVYGQLMLSRAFGDWELKPYGVSNVPHITRTELTPNDKYLIIATDGIWDVFEDEDVYQLSLTAQNTDDLCKTIIKMALAKGSMDNLSCFVIKLV